MQSVPQAYSCLMKESTPNAGNTSSQFPPLFNFCFRTQPKTMFAQVESDDEDSKNEPEWKKRKIWLSFKSCSHGGQGQVAVFPTPMLMK